jgi:putative membrane protein insertion efficiency factor
VILCVGGNLSSAPRRSGSAREPASPHVATRVVRAIAIAPVVVYQKIVSPLLVRRCKYEPTCSRYAIQAVGEYGILRGVVLAGWRLLRCNPWSYGGYDPVAAQRLFGRSGHGRC